MKYIMFLVTLKDGTPIYIPFIFPKCLVHEYVAACMEVLLKSQFKLARVVSAGEVMIFGMDITCSGKSTTLNVESRPEDAMIIHNYQYTSGAICSEVDEILAKAMALKPKP